MVCDDCIVEANSTDIPQRQNSTGKTSLPCSSSSVICCVCTVQKAAAAAAKDPTTKSSVDQKTVAKDVNIVAAAITTVNSYTAAATTLLVRCPCSVHPVCEICAPQYLLSPGRTILNLSTSVLEIHGPSFDICYISEQSSTSGDPTLGRTCLVCETCLDWSSSNFVDTVIVRYFNDASSVNVDNRECRSLPSLHLTTWAKFPLWLVENSVLPTMSNPPTLNPFRYMLYSPRSMYHMCSKS